MCVDPAGGLRPGYELKLNSYDLGVDIELADAVRAPALRAPRGPRRRRLLGHRQRLLRRRQHPHARHVDPRVQGELLQVHQRDPLRHRGRDRLQRQVYIAAGQRHLRRRRLRARPRLRRDLLATTATRPSACPRSRCSACSPAPAASPASSTSARSAATAPTCSRPPPRASAASGQGVEPRRRRVRRAASSSRRSMKRAARSPPAAELLPGERKGVTLGPLTPELAGPAATATSRLAGRPAARTASSRPRPERRRCRDRPPPAPRPSTPPATSCGRCGPSASSTTRCCSCASTTRHRPRAPAHRRRPDQVLAHDAALVAAREHWFVNEVHAAHGPRAARLDLTSRASSRSASRRHGRPAFAGCLLELALAADRFYCSTTRAVRVGLERAQRGGLPMSHGLTRLAARSTASRSKLEALLGSAGCSTPRRPTRPAS
jgi:benzoyl-CoA-dihydrodiol lyase